MRHETQDQNFFHALTGLRAIAAYMVYLRHYNPMQPGTGLYNFFDELNIGVSLFFVLSGFLIAFRYYDAGRFCFKNYMVKRFARIYPMYFLLTTLTFIAMLLKTEATVNMIACSYFLNISFLRGFSEIYALSGIPQGWTLTVEETFYILAPIIFLLIKKNKALQFVLPFILLAIGIGLVQWIAPLHFHGFFSSYNFMLNNTFFGRCFEFFCGIALAIFIKGNFKKPSFKYFTYAGALTLLAFIVALSIIKEYNNLENLQILQKLLLTFLIAAATTLLYYGLVKEKTIVSQVLGSKLFVLLGQSSYTFYLIHVGIVTYFLNNYISNYLLQFAFLNIIAIVLFKLIEEPANRYLRKNFSKHPY